MLRNINVGDRSTSGTSKSDSVGRALAARYGHFRRGQNADRNAHRDTDEGTTRALAARCPRLLRERLSLPRVLGRTDEGNEIIIARFRVYRARSRPRLLHSP